MKTKRWFYYILTFWLVLVMAFGMWWLYLLFKLGAQLKQLQDISQSTTQYSKLINMLELEGTTFLFVLFIGGCFAAWVYFQDIKKSRSVQAFFSSLTHELKTPLASMRLQAEFIEELSETTGESAQLKTLIKRLLEDSQSLEVQMDKALQLARIEQGGKFSLRSVNLLNFLNSLSINYLSQYTFHFDIEEDLEVMIDDMAMQLILKNFLENTKRHQSHIKDIWISTRSHQAKPGKFIYLTYTDKGYVFKGEMKQLGKLFYKHNSSQGTGVGLYLCSRLAKALSGELIFIEKPNLHFQLKVLRSSNKTQASYEK